MKSVAPARLRMLVLGVIVLAGVLFLLPLPFTGDQALFSLGGRGLRHDVAYYRDFWDVKQPGIYWLYAALGGIHDGPFVVHLFNIAWCVGLTVLLQRGTRDWFSREWVSAVTPLFVVLPYLLTAGAENATLIEPLAALPTVACLIWGVQSAKSGALRPLAYAGVVAGLAGVFKLVLLPALLVAALGPLLLDATARKRVSVVRATLVCVVSSAVPLALAVIALLAGGAEAGVIWRTTFSYPSQISHLPGMHSFAQLKYYTKQGIRALLLPGALAVLALPAALNRSRSPRRTLILTLLAVTVVAFALTLPQKMNLYQVYVLSAPLGLLASFGLDRLLDLELVRVRRNQLVAAALAVVVASPLAFTAAQKFGPLVRNKGALTSASRENYREDIAPEYAAVKRQVREARTGGVPEVKGSFFAMANPLYYRAVGVDRQALQHNGWSPEMMTDRQWREWTRELITSRPQTLVVDGFSESYISEHAPEALAFLRAHYSRVFQGHEDEPDLAVSWWTTNDPGTPAPHAGAIQL